MLLWGTRQPELPASAGASETATPVATAARGAPESTATATAVCGAPEAMLESPASRGRGIIALGPAIGNAPGNATRLPGGSTPHEGAPAIGPNAGIPGHPSAPPGERPLALAARKRRGADPVVDRPGRRGPEGPASVGSRANGGAAVPPRGTGGSGEAVAFARRPRSAVTRGDRRPSAAAFPGYRRSSVVAHHHRPAIDRPVPPREARVAAREGTGGDHAGPLGHPTDEPVPADETHVRREEAGMVSVKE